MAISIATHFGYHFRWQYDWAKSMLANTGQFHPDYASILLTIQKLMSGNGFEPVHAEVLDRLRAKIAAGCKGQRTVDAGQSILHAAGAQQGHGQAIDHTVKMSASALKLLQHVYLIEHAGNRHVCICSLPKYFYHWPSMQMHETVTTYSGAHQLLNSKREHFTALQKKQLVGACALALAWAHRTNMVLALATSKDARNAKQREVAQNMVRRWFADSTTTQTELEKYIGILQRGFKKISGRLNRGKFVLVDWVPLRRSVTDEEKKLQKTGAFVLPDVKDSLDVIYIGNAFFDKKRDVLAGQNRWARVILHEFSHLVCNTNDIKGTSNLRYAWHEIGPHSGFPAREAIKNADNWAIFSADCSMALTEIERHHALRQT